MFTHVHLRTHITYHTCTHTLIEAHTQCDGQAHTRDLNMYHCPTHIAPCHAVPHSCRHRDSQPPGQPALPPWLRAAFNTPCWVYELLQLPCDLRVVP
eukprot:GDKI01031802.1.p1 GENE.GDKI01031802.1~~GDKI01031802.1.p1  ORF type:complete len:108 (+),score=14.59 GDKI01031802.1:34-324(+)